MIFKLIIFVLHFQKMATKKILTLVVVRRDGEVLLGMKKRGFGEVSLKCVKLC